MKEIKLKKWILFVSLCLLLLSGCHTLNRDFDAIPNAIPKKESRSKYGNPDCYEVEGKKYYVLKDAKGYCKKGTASWYGMKFHGKKTSSREPYDMFSMTAASPTLPIPTYVEVTNLENGRKIIVKINDRGPFKSDRIIDLSYAAAKKLGFADKGSAQVEVKALDPDEINKTDETSVIIANSKQTEEFVEIDAQKLKEHLKDEKPVSLKRYIQLGAFKEEANAAHLKKEVADVTQETASINQGSIDDKIIYRVQIGPFDTADESNRIVQKLKDHGFEKVITVFR